MACTEALHVGVCCDNSAQHSSLTTCAIVAPTAPSMLHSHQRLTNVEPVSSSLVTSCGQQCCCRPVPAATCILFGDGSGAVLMTQQDEACSLLGADMHSDGGGQKHLNVSSWPVSALGVP